MREVFVPFLLQVGIERALERGLVNLDTALLSLQRLVQQLCDLFVLHIHPSSVGDLLNDFSSVGKAHAGRPLAVLEHFLALLNGPKRGYRHSRSGES